jgi:hypothetical protein
MRGQGCAVMAWPNPATYRATVLEKMAGSGPAMTV